MKLVIFDLDQTLVDFLEIHDEATHQLLQRYFGINVRLTDIDFAGRSLLDNFVELAAFRGIDKDRVIKQSKELLQSYESIFASLMPDETEKNILPGARKLLDELSCTANFLVLYTGDSPGIAQKILQTTGLGKYFHFAVFGTDSRTRTEMAGEAIRKAENITGNMFTGKNIVIVGDSIRDIDVGKDYGALTIAVTTGFHSKEKLAQHNPDYIFPNLKDRKKIIKVITM